MGESYEYPGESVRDLLLRNGKNTIALGLIAFALIVPPGGDLVLRTVLKLALSVGHAPRPY